VPLLLSIENDLWTKQSR